MHAGAHPICTDAADESIRLSPGTRLAALAAAGDHIALLGEHHLHPVDHRAHTRGAVQLWVKAYALGQAVEERLSAKPGLEVGQAAGDRRLAQPERPPGGAHRPFARNREKPQTSSQSISWRLNRNGRAGGFRRRSPPAITDALRAAMKPLLPVRRKRSSGSLKTMMIAIQLGRYDGAAHQTMEIEMATSPPTIIDLNAELAKLTMFRGLTPRTTRSERQGSGALLGPYRDGILIAGKSAGTSHWEDHPEDELVHVLDGTKVLDVVCDDGPPKSFVVRAGMIAIVPKGAWHRFRSLEGGTTWSATLPGDHIEQDVDDPRTAVPKKLAGNGTPSIVDLNAELAKLVMFGGRTPQSTMEDRKGSGAKLAPYRDGGLFVTKFAGKGHWEAHLPGDELVYIVDGTVTLELVLDDGPPKSFPLSAGMVAVNPQRAWHRFYSADGVTLMTATPSPSTVIEFDIDDPRKAKQKPG